MVGGCKPIIRHNSNSTLGGVELTWSGDGVGLEWRWSLELSWSLAKDKWESTRRVQNSLMIRAGIMKIVSLKQNTLSLKE